MAYTTIDKPTDYFNTKLYTGNNSTLAVTGVGFQPDWVWIKNRDSAVDHALFDIIRGGDNRLESNTADAEATNTDGITSFDSDGFTLSNGSSRWNGLSDYASWNWLASNTTASNTDGSITSTVSANTTSGFSIVSYTGTGANATVGHGLGSTPACIIIKNRTDVTSWTVYHKTLTGTSSLSLDTTATTNTGIGVFNNTDPTSSVFTVGVANGTNGSGDDMIAYCFAEKKGFSKFGSYTGNGNADGTFIYTGMKTSFVIIKRTDSADNWYVYDNKRDTENPQAVALNADTSGSEFSTSNILDFLSNGFKLRSSEVTTNASGGSYIYIAFAESPFTTSTGIPTTAR